MPLPISSPHGDARAALDAGRLAHCPRRAARTTPSPAGVPATAGVRLGPRRMPAGQPTAPRNRCGPATSPFFSNTAENAWISRFAPRFVRVSIRRQS